ncbi:sodium-coupled monocarboxylate transporter 1-like isoform X2 [Paramacrobiotus metropolitanus]|nr:sodium-coupled monocarboxylate transporter 1-like isoform X2 [Paramacrobiotus metropolitanus]
MKSVYEYFEHRFNWTLRRCACLIFMINMFLYMALVLYAPALALSQVSALPLWASIVTTGLICTIYTAIGGMKAVVWTDAFQMSVMLCGIMTIFIHGLVISGGPTKIYQENLATGRLSVSFDPDPFQRQSFWSLLIGGFFTILPFGMNQATVQRYLSVRSKNAAQKVIAIQCPTTIFWWLLLIFTGATMYTYYQGCDPGLSGRTERKDQTMALYVLDTVGYLQGLPGLFTAVVYSATLSTVSSGVNSIVIVLMEDFIKPLSPSLANAERAVMRWSKGLSFLVGFLAIGMALLASVVGQGLTQFCMSIEGMCGGPLLGLFFCGMMLPFCNSKGATVGIIAGLAMTFWIGIGSIVTTAPEPHLPLSADKCDEMWMRNTTLLSNLTTAFPTTTPALLSEAFSYSGTTPAPDLNILSSTTAPPLSFSGGISKMYKLSFQYYGFIGFWVTIIVASIVSLVTGGEDTSRIPDRFFLYKVFSDHSKDVEEVGYEWTGKNNKTYHSLPMEEENGAHSHKGTSKVTTFNLPETSVGPSKVYAEDE